MPRRRLLSTSAQINPSPSSIPTAKMVICSVNQVLRQKTRSPQDLAVVIEPNP